MFRLDSKPYEVKDLDTILDEAMKEGIQTNNQGVSFWKIVFAFDIETSSFTGHVTKTDHNDKRSVMYIWQLDIEGETITGRTWEEFKNIINILEDILPKRMPFNLSMLYISLIFFSVIPPP